MYVCMFVFLQSFYLQRHRQQNFSFFQLLFIYFEYGQSQAILKDEFRFFENFIYHTYLLLLEMHERLGSNLMERNVWWSSGAGSFRLGLGFADDIHGT